MSQDLSNRVLFLDGQERIRLATWLRQYDLPSTINPGRAQQLKDGSSEYVSSKEIALFMDELYPIGSALDIIRGFCRVQVQEVA